MLKVIHFIVSHSVTWVLILFIHLIVSSTVIITPDPKRQSPATFTAGENLSLKCSSTLNNPSYSWSTSLTDEDGDSIETDSATIMGTFLHGANTGTHTCTATSGGNNEEKSYVLTVEGMYSFLYDIIIVM